MIVLVTAITLVLLVWAVVVLAALLCIIKALEDLDRDGCREMKEAYEAFMADCDAFDEWEGEDW